MSATQGTPFRQEALAHYAARHHDGSLLRMSTRWTRWSFWLIVATFIAAGVYATFGRIHEYATGPAIIRVDGREDVAAPRDGLIATVEVRAGQRVVEDQPLVALEDEHDLVRGAAAIVHAPRAGVVSDLRARPGQRVGAGETLLAIVGDDARLSLVALLPGHYRPMLRPGMPIRFELVGYRYEYRELAIDSIADEVVGPTEARRRFGVGNTDGLAIDEPVVLVRATLGAAQFTSNGETFRYYDGLRARAQARLRSEPILLNLLPGLKALGRHGS